MKRFIFFIFIMHAYERTYSSDNLQQMYASSPLNNNNASPVHNLINSVSSYPTLGITSDATHVVQTTANRSIKALTPTKTHSMTRSAGLSILRPNAKAFMTYPTGNNFFKDYPILAAKFDQMITNFKNNPHFVTFFRKVHINILNELYNYLLGIYMNFSLQHPGIVQLPSGDLQVSLPAFMQEEEIYNLNVKTLVINHLIAVIESQFNSAIRSYAQKIPQTFATYIGKTAIQNDYSIDLTQFILHQTKQELIDNKKAYLAALASYLEFFQSYTAYLKQPHPTQPTNAFVHIAQQVNTFLYADASADQDKYLIALQKMNPPLLHFGYEDVRALKIIPYLAQQIPTTTKNVAWPEHIVKAAQQGLVLSSSGQTPHPIAYFRTKDGIIVRNVSLDTSIPLYICMRLGQNLFEQQLVPQPDWLNSWQGVSKILQACYGDFSAIVDLNILDDMSQALVKNVMLLQQGHDANAPDNIYPQCQKRMNLWNKIQTTPFVGPTSPNTTIASAATAQLPTMLPQLSTLPPLSAPLLNQP